MSHVLSLLHDVWKPGVEIALFWCGYYILLKFLQSTGALQILKGVFVVFLLFASVQFLGLTTIENLMTEIFPISIIGFLVVFQNELRRGLTRIGQSPLFKLFLKEEHIVDDLVKTAAAMSKKKMGALIAIEREISLKQFSETGVTLDANLSFELLSTIFMQGTLLHDGGIIIRGNRIESAGCLFPLSQSTKISKALGTRHRAALGLSEETDAMIIVVSEETGTISIAENGSLERDVDSDRLLQHLIKLYQQPKQAHSNWINRFKDNGNASAR